MVPQKNCIDADGKLLDDTGAPQCYLDDDKFALDPIEASRFLTEEMQLPTSPSTLAKWRWSGGGPIYRKHGRRVRYTETRLREYALSRISPEIGSTSEGAQ